jgi:hypothetical protein
MTVRHIESLQGVPQREIASIALCLSCVDGQVEDKALWLDIQGQKVRLIRFGGDTLTDRGVVDRFAQEHDQGHH